MTPRSFHNKLKGFRALQEREELRHKELMFTILSPHIAKESDRKKMHKELFGQPVLKPQTLNSKPKTDPVKFWEEIDKKTVNSKPKTARE